nr:hypothetical protein CFP56_53686 [Quercus suber]
MEVLASTIEIVQLHDYEHNGVSGRCICSAVSMRSAYTGSVSPRRHEEALSGMLGLLASVTSMSKSVRISDCTPLAVKGKAADASMRPFDSAETPNSRLRSVRSHGYRDYNGTRTAWQSYRRVIRRVRTLFLPVLVRQWIRGTGVQSPTRLLSTLQSRSCSNVRKDDVGVKMVTSTFAVGLSRRATRRARCSANCVDAAVPGRSLGIASNEGLLLVLSSSSVHIYSRECTVPEIRRHRDFHPGCNVLTPRSSWSLFQSQRLAGSTRWVSCNVALWRCSSSLSVQYLSEASLKSLGFSFRMERTGNSNPWILMHCSFLLPEAMHVAAWCAHVSALVVAASCAYGLVGDQQEIEGQGLAGSFLPPQIAFLLAGLARGTLARTWLGSFTTLSLVLIPTASATRNSTTSLCAVSAAVRSFRAYFRCSSTPLSIRSTFAPPSSVLCEPAWVRYHYTLVCRLCVPISLVTSSLVLTVVLADNTADSGITRFFQKSAFYCHHSAERNPPPSSRYCNAPIHLTLSSQL